ncbi:MAG TPA: CAP domain-containing protein [Candidatus Saccharimonadales bacterium]|nr:CAP domain-containing protein [Candidatus Saccharimonadales bacterium]
MQHKKIIKSHYHIIYPVFLVIFLTVGVTVALTQAQTYQIFNTHAATTNCTVPSSQLAIKAQEQELFDDINKYRVQQGVNALSWNDTLKQSAAWQSSDMLAHNTLSHTDSLGRTPDIRLANCGYNIQGGYGENIADQTLSAGVVFSAWQNDPPHNQILLSPNYTITGIDMEQNSAGHAFWTMDLGKNIIDAQETIVPTPNTTITTSPGGNGNQPTSTQPTNTQPTSTQPSGTQPSGTQPSVVAPSSDFKPTTGPVAADMLISVTVMINGIGKDGNVTPKHLTRKVIAYVYDATAALVSTGTGFLNYNNNGAFTGVIHLGQLAQGPYLIKLASADTLQVLAQPAFQTLYINKENVIPPVTLYQGDLNSDNVLDINDYNSALPCFQSNKCADPALDFNDDTTINVLDYNLLLQSYEVLHGD